MREQYCITATKSRKVKTVSGWITTPDGFIVAVLYNYASSEEEAIRNAELHIAGDYDYIRATPVDMLEYDD